MTSDGFELAPRWPAGPAPDERDVAELRLHAAGVSLTRIVDVDLKEERDFIRGSAVSLAFWLADNFWRLCYESLPDGSRPSTNWRLRHELTSASGGTLWPPIMIHSTGERVLFAPVLSQSVDVGALRYVTPGVVTVSGASFVEGLDSFFDQVIGACASAVDGASLVEFLETLRTERADPETASWRQLEARLGYDPDTVPVALMRRLGVLEREVGAAARDEAVAAVPGPQAGRCLTDAVAAAKQSDIVIDLGIARQIALTGSVASVPPWKQGREAAKHIRQIVGLDEEPIRARAFADLLQTTPDTLRKRGTARGLPYAARLRQRNGDNYRVALKSADLRDRRFELSCAIADEIWLQSDFGVMSKAKTDRQKFQRAFAQNLLAPFAGLARRIDLGDPSDLQVEEAAKHYHVHPNLVRRLLILEGVFPEETFEERLEAA